MSVIYILFRSSYRRRKIRGDGASKKERERERERERDWSKGKRNHINTKPR
jgi:hypothetical protein